MKVALVHDYISEFGGAERVLLALTEIWPEAPIYTAFYEKNSSAGRRFRGKDVRPSWFDKLPFRTKLASPLRFLAPLIWGSFDFSGYDVVITSANWYITKGIKKGIPSTSSGQENPSTSSGQGETIEICYCHTPPRYLYGYQTSVEWRKFWPVRVYGMLVGHFLRLYDFQAAQRVDYFVANSENVARRIAKFYRREAKVIYPPAVLDAQRRRAGQPVSFMTKSLRAGPPVEIPTFSGLSHQSRSSRDDLPALKSLAGKSREQDGKDYYLVVSRLVGGKGLELAVEAANKLQVPLKVVGKAAGWGAMGGKLKKLAGSTVEFLGEVNDDRLYELYVGAKAFIVTAEDEDFGITPVEAMACGTPVIAYQGGGYLETVGERKTGVFFRDLKVESLCEAIGKLEKLNITGEACKIQAERFTKERFKREVVEYIKECVEKRKSG